jgi:hypothetical protein
VSKPRGAHLNLVPLLVHDIVHLSRHKPQDVVTMKWAIKLESGSGGGEGKVRGKGTKGEGGTWTV